MKQHIDKIFTDNGLSNLFEITKIGCWRWDLSTNQVLYSKEWAEIVGYELEELEQTLDTWQNMVDPRDAAQADIALESHLSGETEMYETELRLIRKDGSTIWVQDKGKIIEYDKDGKPKALTGVLIDIHKFKLTLEALNEQKEHFSVAVRLANFAIWELDCPTGNVSYSNEFYSILGYTKGDLTLNTTGWEKELVNKQDFEKLSHHLDNVIHGHADSWLIEVQVKRKDGIPIWMRVFAEIVERDEKGKALKIVGGNLDIDDLKKAQDNLEEEVKERTKEIIENEKMLAKVAEISQRLMSEDEDINKTVGECLTELCTLYGRERITAWQNITINGELYCKNIFKWRKEKGIVSRKPPCEDDLYINNGLPIIHYTNNNDEVYAKALLDRILNGHLIKYNDHFPSLVEHMLKEKTMNILYSEAQNSEKAFLRYEGVKSALVSPVYHKGEPWGYLRIDNFDEEKHFSKVEENMLNITGSLFASAIQKAETEEELRIAHAEAIASTKAKSNFLANMSHEIRTPMNAITGMAEILLRELGDHPASEYAAGIKQAGSNLLTIINDILDISKIESGKLDIVKAEYTLSSLLNDVITMARLRVESKALDFFTHIDCNLPQKLMGDEGRIKQILINLLTNAIKFTHEGHVGLHVSGFICEDEIGLKFKIFDTGVGIKQEDMARLFEEFERVNTTKNRSIEGTGLGLAISKQLCEMMGGNIYLESEYGKGSTFTVHIKQKITEYEPIASVPEKKKVLLYESRELYVQYIKMAIENLGSECISCTNQSELFENLQEQHFDFVFTSSLHLPKVQQLIAKQSSKSKIVMYTQTQNAKFIEGVYTLILPTNCMQVAAALNNTSSMQFQRAEKNRFKAPQAKILVVDDNYVNLKVAKGLMEPYEFTIETAENGLIALEKIQAEHFDLVFMDHMMPEMDGIDATIAIRKLEGDYYQNLPIVALTANAIIGIRDLFIKEGMNDFLEKPIEMRKLNTVLAKWLPEEMQIPIDENEETKKHTQEYGEIAGIDIAKGIQSIGGNYESYLDILGTYYTDGLKKHSFIRTLHMSRDLVAFKTEVHAIKSASASIGALDLSSKAFALENASSNEDWIFIDDNVEEFLTDFHKLISALQEYLAERQEVQKSNGEGKTSLIKEKINPLAEAIDCVDLPEIESILNELCTYEWEEPFSEYLNGIKISIEAYDYDEGMEYVEKIKKIL